MLDPPDARVLLAILLSCVSIIKIAIRRQSHGTAAHTKQTKHPQTGGILFLLRR